MTRSSIIVRLRFWIAILEHYLGVFILPVDQLATATPWAVHMRAIIEARHEVLSALLPRIAMHTEGLLTGPVREVPPNPFLKFVFASPPLCTPKLPGLRKEGQPPSFLVPTRCLLSLLQRAMRTTGQLPRFQGGCPGIVLTT